jgi:hypothetical protein
MATQKKTANWKHKQQKQTVSLTPAVFKKPFKIPTTEKLVKLKPVRPKCKPVSSCDVIDKNYLHLQITPLAVWQIAHNLKKFPSVTIMSSTGQIVYADTN